MDSSGQKSAGEKVAAAAAGGASPPPPPSVAFDAIENLVERIGLGEVVFFVGAGFSLDSEWNSASRLMRRLLWRLQALTIELRLAVGQTLRDSGAVREFDDQLRAALPVLEQIPRSLQRTFGLGTVEDDNWSKDAETFAWSGSDIGTMAEKYYESNDWFCATFEKLLETGYVVGDAAGADEPSKGKRLQELIDAVTARESAIRMPAKKPTAGSATRKSIDDVPLCSIIPCLFRWAHSSLENQRRDAGKTLFLDTMGFADEAIMGGSPEIRDAEDHQTFNGRYKDARRQIAKSYRGRLYARHQVLARLAREGLCPIVLTTNYDLLLEGAWRLSGFEVARPFVATKPDDKKHQSPFDPALPSTPLKGMAVVASPVGFVEKGKANRTSLVVKVHGCVDEYRARREPCSLIKAADVFQQASDLDWKKQEETVGRWEAYLQQMVFTYREIQNWREDSWARDYLATLQRTRSVAFVGYSLQDPVIHDAFRTVYEDMAGHHERDPKPDKQDGKAPRKPNPEVAPAFFLGNAQDQSFHATEVLHAATHAAGGKVAAPHDHSNYLRFWFRHEELFPNIDDIFLWTFHRTMRERQLRMLRDDLRSAAAMLLRNRNFSSDCSPLQSRVERIVERFEKVVRAEKETAAQWFVADPVVDRLMAELTEVRGRTPRTPEDCSRIAELETALRPHVRRHEKFRRQLQRIAHWTWSFHPALWKEFACAQMLKRRDASLHSIDDLRTSDWYQPAIAGPGRVAWGVTIELALRWLLGRNAKRDSQACLLPCGELQPVGEAVPSVLFFHEKRSFEDVNHGGLPDGLRLSCGRSSHKSKELSDSLAGLWHEWSLPADGRIWDGSEHCAFQIPANIRRRRNVIRDERLPRSRESDDGEEVVREGRSCREIVTAPPSAEAIWVWAQGLNIDNRFERRNFVDQHHQSGGPNIDLRDWSSRG